jgi:hypothetical protein
MRTWQMNQTAMHACVRWWRRTVGLLRKQKQLNLAWLSLAFGLLEPGREMVFRLHNGGRNRTPSWHSIAAHAGQARIAPPGNQPAG